MSDRAVGIVAKAIQAGDEEGVRKVVKAGACGPNAILPSGDPILLHAIMKGQTSIVTALLELGADVNLPGNEKDTPLIRSAIFGRKEIIPLLLKAGAGTSISATNCRGESALLCSVYNGSISACECLLKHGASTRELEVSPFLIAAKCDKTDILELLWRESSKVDRELAREVLVSEALLVAVSSGKVAVLKALLGKEIGLDANTREGGGNRGAGGGGKNGSSARQDEDGSCARNQRASDTEQKLDREYSDGLTLLMVAAVNNREAAIGVLLDAGADVLAKDGDGNTALHHAVIHGSEACVRALLKGRSNVDARNNNGYTALLCVELLLEKQQSKARGGNAIGSQNDAVTIVKMLIRHRASIEAQDIHGRTALMLAAFVGHLETCQAVVEGGASVETVDNGGRSALHYAVERGHRGIVTFLLKCGADADAKDNNNVSPFSMAKSKGDRRTSRVLLDGKIEGIAFGSYVPFGGQGGGGGRAEGGGGGGREIRFEGKESEARYLAEDDDDIDDGDDINESGTSGDLDSSFSKNAKVAVGGLGTKDRNRSTMMVLTYNSKSKHDEFEVAGGWDGDALSSPGAWRGVAGISSTVGRAGSGDKSRQRGGYERNDKSSTNGKDLHKENVGAEGDTGGDASAEKMDQRGDDDEEEELDQDFHFDGDRGRAK